MLALRRLAAASVLLFMTLPMAVQDASGDGITAGYNPVTSSWWMTGEDAQFAVINYDAPNESLLLQTSIPYRDVNSASQLYWLVPIPCAAANASIGIFREFPGFGGHFVDDAARLSISNDFFWIYSSQLYAAPLALTSLYTLSGPLSQQRPVMLAPKLGVGSDGSQSVEVFQRVVHFGLETELVSASSISAFEQYESDHGITLPSAATPVIEQYINEGYAFVASRVMNVSAFMANSAEARGFTGPVYSLSVMVKFQTPKMFFPLRMSSVYGSAKIPTVLEIVDYSKPLPFSHQVPDLSMETDYIFEGHYAVSSDLQPFFAEQASKGQLKGGVLSDLELTLVTIEASAQNLDEDLWLEEGAPATVQSQSFVRENSLLLMIPLFLVISMVSSLIGGSYVYRAYHPMRRKFALLGLANATTLVGMFLIAHDLRIDETFVRLEKPEPLFKWKPFLAVFSIVFLALSLCCHLVINTVLL